MASATTHDERRTMAVAVKGPLFAPLLLVRYLAPRLASFLAMLPLLAPAITEPAGAAALAPYKDALFAYPAVLYEAAGGDFKVVEYSKERDLRERDEVDERRVFPQYVSLYPKRLQDDRTLRLDRSAIHYIAVGDPGPSTRVAVIYLHGRGGNRHQGANDWMFGGNFNRIKNLMARNGGLYLSPDFSDFDKKGTREIKALMEMVDEKAPNARIILACGSMGGLLCWNLAKDRKASGLIDGMMLLGSVNDEAFLYSDAFRNPRKRFPIYLGHGTFDPYIPWKSQETFFKKIRRASPGYPIKLVLFDSGSHGTPIRMTDWRLILNWMLSVRR